MRPSPYTPKLHLFVCTNRRAEDDPLGSGCGSRGEAVYDALKACVARAQDWQRVWVTQTKCLGICPRTGASVASYSASGSPPGSSPRVFTEVEGSEAAAFYEVERANALGTALP